MQDSEFSLGKHFFLSWFIKVLSGCPSSQKYHEFVNFASVASLTPGLRYCLHFDIK